MRGEMGGRAKGQGVAQEAEAPVPGRRKLGSPHLQRHLPAILSLRPPLG